MIDSVIVVHKARGHSQAVLDICVFVGLGLRYKIKEEGCKPLAA
jgi:hypothetical protein